MKNKNEIRWMQLSDMHMFDSTEVERQKKSLYEQFRGKIDFFVITGDLHQYNTDYCLTKIFLEELVVEMQITKKDIIIVPGNHDAEDNDERKKIIDDIDKNIEANPDVYHKNMDSLLNSFNKFKEFLQDFYGKEIKTNNLLNNRLYVWNNCIAIVCLNTALISNKKHYRPQIVDIYGLEKLNDHRLKPVGYRGLKTAV